jgi:septum formation protein
MSDWILASASPRRRELLERVGLSPRVMAVDIDETPFPGEEAVSYARRMAEEKARACPVEGALVLAADTVVHLEGRIFGKPLDEADARRMLSELSGREHRVTTGFALRRGDRIEVDHCSTFVRFRELPEDLIRAYVETGEPMDKAGAYGIQGIGACLVTGIVGSYPNVVGLPLVPVLAALARAGGPRPLSEPS